MTSSSSLSTTDAVLWRAFNLPERHGLMDALRSSAALVEQESPAARFFLACSGNVHSAAQRLCRYWNERKSAFQERAFLPLHTYLNNLTYSSVPLASASATVSALTESDAAEFNQDLFFSFLPLDAQGCPVLYYDKTLTVNRGILSHVGTQHNHTSPTSQRARLLFTGCQKLAAAANSSTDGYVFVLRVDPTESVLALRFHKAHLELGTLLAQVFPLKLKAWHVVVVLPSSSRSVPASSVSGAAGTTAATAINDPSTPSDLAAWIQQALPVLLLRWEAILGRPVEHIHAGIDEASVIASLRQHGLRLDRLPATDNISWPALLRGASLSTASTNNGASTEQKTEALRPSSTASHAQQSTRPSVPQPPPTTSAPPRTGDAVSQSTDSGITPTASTATAHAATPTDLNWQQSAVKAAEESGVLDDATMQSKGLQQLADAIRFLPDYQTAAYRQAQEICPELVEKESHPLRFLRFHRYNAWSAAQRITTYWRRRQEIFGDRWKLPMTMTGDGAMNQEDITYLRMGYFCFLPNDQKGRTVICYDPSRRLDHSKLARMRIGFYFWSIISENEACIRNGYVGIVLLGNGSFGASSLDGTIRECVDIVVDCFPTTTKNIHLVQTLQPPGVKRSLLQMLLPVLSSLMGRILENTSVQHVSDSRGEMTKEFESFGLSPSGLPSSCGGSWIYDDFYQWQLERCRLERKAYDWERYPKFKAEVTENLPEASMRGLSLPGMSLPMTLSSTLASSDHNLLVQMDYHIRRFSHEERSAYMEAMNQVPHLVRDDCRAAWFLMFAGNDVHAAARQLAGYWGLRRQLFGDRAFLPMAQTGEGALGRKELSLLSSSFFTILPTRQDEQVIVSFDCARDDMLDEYVRLRVVFYILSLVAERDSSRTRGFQIVASGMRELARLQEEGAVTNSTPFYSILAVLPIRVAAIHMAMLLQADTALYPLDDTVQSMRRLFGQAGSTKGLVHVGTSRDEIIEHLIPYGIQRDIVPKSLGGGFGYDRFTQWQELRIRYEWGLPAGANDQDASNIYDFSKVIPYADLPEADKKERKRRMNVVHSRRKRERERIEIECLQEQCEELRHEQKSIAEETTRLQNLLRRAEAVATAEMAKGS